MKSLSQHDMERTEKWKCGDSNDAEPNGIACPECGAELRDVQRGISVHTNGQPPRCNVWCKACDWRGTRVE